jgi:hypothetical protein
MRKSSCRSVAQVLFFSCNVYYVYIATPISNLKIKRRYIPNLYVNLKSDNHVK